MRGGIAGAAIGLIIACCATSAHAQANVAVADWDTFCLQTRGNTTEAFARADAAGFAPLPQGEGRSLRGEGGQRTLMFVTNQQRMCMTSHPTTSAMNVFSEVQALLGHAPTSREGVWSFWMIDSTGGELHVLENDETERARTAFSGGHGVIVRAGIENGLDIVMYEFRP